MSTLAAESAAALDSAYDEVGGFYGREVREVGASEVGALDGFESTCQTCGMVLASSLFQSLLFDITTHGRYHDGRDAR